LLPLTSPKSHCLSYYWCPNSHSRQNHVVWWKLNFYPCRVLSVEQWWRVLRRPLRQLNKNVSLFSKNSPLFQIFIKFRYFSAIFGLFVQVTTSNKCLIFALVHQFWHVFLSKFFQNKIPLFFLYFWLKQIAVPLSKCRRY
jgi:hypothetical protein